MRKAYSRLASVEERKNIKRTFLFGILTVIFLVFLFTLGVPLLVKFTGFFTDLGKSQTPIDKSDTIPPAPPRIDAPVEFTNQTSVIISGTTEPGATITLSLNGKTQEVLANKDGEFTFDIKLNKGENTLSALAKDAAGNVSQETKTYTVTFDNEPPEIQIESPSDGTEFFGSKERQLSIKGKTEGGVSLDINGRLVVVEDDGSFTFTTTLSEGENTFNIKAADKAGNTKEDSLMVRFSP
jgi:hypothetical protein